MAGENVKFAYLTQSAYDTKSNSGQLNDGTLYFISDSHRLYKKDVPIANDVEVCTTYPSTGTRLGVLYINTAEKSMKYWNGSAWVAAMPKIISYEDGGIQSNSDDVNIPTLAAVYNAIEAKTSGIGVSLLPVENLTELKTLTTMEDTNTCNVIETGSRYKYYETVPKDDEGNFVIADDDTYVQPSNGVGMWVLEFRSTSYKGGNGIEIVDGTIIQVDYNEAELQIVEDTGLGVKKVIESKVYVTGKDGSETTLQSDYIEKMYRPDSYDVNNVVIFTANGHANDSGKTLGGSTLASSPTENVLATEAAVKTYVDDSKLKWE